MNLKMRENNGMRQGARWSTFNFSNSINYFYTSVMFMMKVQRLWWGWSILVNQKDWKFC